MRKEELKIFVGTLIVGIVFMIILMAAAPCCFGAEVEADELAADWDTGYTRDDFLARNNLNAEDVVFVTPDTVTTEMLVTRTPETLIVEEIVGVVLDYRKDGKHDGFILNTTDDYYNYICYEDYDVPFEYGDIVATYFIYDRYGHGEDDFERADEYVIDTDQLIEE